MVQINPSEGEKLLAEFFEENLIKFESEKVISDLKGDEFPYRKADFYLPQYKTYVEFLGKWHDEKAKQKYIQKMKVYELNKKPCIYLYPENLGILDWLFEKRLKKVLKEYHLEKELFWYNLKLFKEDSENLVTLLIISAALGYYTPSLTLRIIMAVLIFFITYHLYSLRKEIFKD